MATIPIEVIVQDAEAPVVPGEDGTNNTETNITVPDTGTISSSGDTSYSASSIILPAILLVLAIGSIVAILIHKYHKQKKDKISKKEKLAVATSSIIAVLAATVLIGNLVIPATKAAASDTVDGITPAEDKISITVTRDSSSAEASTESTATITSSSDFGYKIFLSMAENVETSNLYLNGDEASEHYITATESTELTDNTWGYALTEDGEYSAIPLLDNAVTVAQGDEPVEDESLNIYYGVKVSSDLPAGTYAGGEIEYTLEGYSGFPSTLTTMQGMTHEICESVYTPKAFKADGATIEDNVPTTTLTDIRDNKTYTIAKLADGKCWMTQNLDLQAESLKQGMALDSMNTDNPASGFTLPVSQVDVTDNNKNWGYDESSINTSHVYDMESDGRTYRYCIKQDGPDCSEYGDTISGEKLGNLYNWYAATAGTGTYSTGGTGEGLHEATGSICPAGWRLPDNSNGTQATDYSKLLYGYSILQSPTSSRYESSISVNLYLAPFFFVPAGRYAFGGVYDPGNTGSLWSFVASNAENAQYFFFSTNGISPWGDVGKSYGSSVRCLAK